VPAPNEHAKPDHPFNLEALLKDHHHELMDLHEKHINPAVVAVLKTIGFDQNYVRGQGAYLWDDQGRRYIDCLGGYAVFACGRNHPAIRDAIAQAMNLDLPNLPGVGLFRVSGLLAKELIHLAPGATSDKPGELDTCFFASAGGEAIDAAIKFARQASGKNRIVHCARSYHGLTLGSLSITGNPEFRDGFGALLADVTEIPFNDPEALERELSKGDVGAFIVEPIQGKGVNMPADDYLRTCSKLCAKHGAIFIVDEIQTGLGRTGKWFASEHYGAGTDWTPDIMVIAKALSGGYVPVSAVLLKRWVHTKTFDGMAKCAKIQNTFSQNDLAMVAGLATLHVMKHERIVENARDVGTYLRDGLKAALSKYEMVKDVRGQGLMIAIEFGRPSALTLRMSWDAVHKVDPNLFCQSIIIPLMKDHAILTQVAGYKLDNIKLIPTLVLSRADADEIIKAFDATVGAVHKGAGPAWIVPKLAGATLKRFAGSR
jgi:acetylornithine/succinyldiaminopimelate/putrescine aminotransferase